MSVSIIVLVLLVAGIVGVVYLYGLYAGVIQNSNSVREALSGIDVQLKKRHNLIPNILTIAKKFMEHEKSLMEEITKLRSMAQNAKLGSKEKFELEGALNEKLGQFMVQVENYPQLKSDTAMLQAMRTYNEVEEHISASRRFYNSALTQLRNMTTIFPGSLFASFAGDVLNASYFSADESARAPVDANKYLS